MIQRQPAAQSWLSFVHIYEAIIAVLTMRIQHIHHFNVVAMGV